MMANLIIAQLLFLEAEDPDQDISFYINSPGGSVTAGLAIYDTMQYIRPDVSTICIGMAASAAALLLTAGAARKRFTLPHSTIMIHQPLGGMQGQATDIEIHAREILRMKRCAERHSGAPYGSTQTENRGRYGARSLHDRRRSEGVRLDRRGDYVT